MQVWVKVPNFGTIMQGKGTNIINRVESVINKQNKKGMTRSGYQEIRSKPRKALKIGSIFMFGEEAIQ